MWKRLFFWNFKEGTSESDIATRLEVLGTYGTENPGVRNWSVGRNMAVTRKYDGYYSGLTL